MRASVRAVALALVCVACHPEAAEVPRRSPIVLAPPPPPPRPDSEEATWVPQWWGRPDVAEISPDGKLIALADETSVVLFRPDVEDVMAQMKARGAGVRWLFFDPGGTRLATLSHQGELNVWRLSDLAHLTYFAPAEHEDHSVYHVESEGGFVAWDSSVGAWLADLSRGTITAVGGPGVAPISFSRHGRNLLVFYPDPTSRLVAVVPDRPAYGPPEFTWTRAIDIYAVDSGRHLGSFTPGRHPKAVSWSADGRELFVGLGHGTFRSLTFWAGSEVERWDVHRRQKVGVLSGGSALVDPEGRWILTLRGQPTRSEKVETLVYDPASHALMATLPGHPVPWAPPGDSVVTEVFGTAGSNSGAPRQSRHRFALPSGGALALGALDELRGPRSRAWSSSRVVVESGGRGKLRFVRPRDGRYVEVFAFEAPDGRCVFGAIDERGRVEGNLPIRQRFGRDPRRARTRGASPPRAAGLVRELF